MYEQWICVYLFLIKQNKMSNPILCILPNTLYRKSIIQKISSIYNISECVIWEHPSYFTKYEFNKKKLIFHRVTMKAYYDRVKQLFSECRYVSFYETLEINNKNILYVFDSVNIVTEFQAYKTFYIGTPNFMLSNQDLDFIRSIHKKKKNGSSETPPPYNPFFKSNAIRFVNEITDDKSIEFKSFHEKDVMNRNTRLHNFKRLEIKSRNNNDEHYILEAMSYVDKFFCNNIGNGNDQTFIFPINHEEARLWFQYTIQRMSLYEVNYIETRYDHILFTPFDTILSSCLNVGFLNPNEIIQTMKNMHNKVSRLIYLDIMNKLLYREYKRFLYVHYRVPLTSVSHTFQFNNKLSSIWYKGETAMYPVNLIVNKSIQRCMISEKEAIYIVGSYMLVKEIGAMYVFKWLMEMSVDSHEWWVFFTVYGLIYKKNFIERFLKSSEKLNNMFGFDPKFEWPKIWDETIHHFRRKHKNRMLKPKVKA